MFNRSPCFLPFLLAVLITLPGCESIPETSTTPAPPPAAALPAEPPAPPIEPAPAPEPAAQIYPATEPAQAAVEVPEPKPPAPVACTPPKPVKPAAPERPKTVLPILGGVETIIIDPPGLALTARLNTGSDGSILDARSIREFERDGELWVKFQLVDRKTKLPTEVSRPVVRASAAKNAATAKRYVISIRTRVSSIDQFVEYTLADRSWSRYPVVLGRNFLRDQALVDVARRFTTANPARP